MLVTRLGSSLLLGMGIALLGACGDGSQAPTGRAVPPLESDRPAGSMLEPVDLVYICGNRFLATNATDAAVHVTYRVVGTDETGGLTLREGGDQDQSFSETDLETKDRGTVELYQDGERVARRGNEGRACGAPAVSALVAGTSAGGGSWSAPFPWPNVAIHLSLLPDGRVLSWGSSEGPYTWDPATGATTRVPSRANVFCAGHAFLPDGRLLVSGGHITEDHGIPDNTIFDPASNSWSTSTPMLRGRWYPTNTTLSNGDVVIIAGRDQLAERVLEPEVWSPGGMRVLTGASRAFPYYPRTFLAPNGKVFYAGEQRPSRYLDVTGRGDWESGFTSILYGNREYGAAVMYDAGKVLYVGGGRTTNTAEIIDLNSAAPAWQWTGSMAFPRRHLNATLLPTGEVLATSGTSGPGFNDIATVVHAAEVWSPVTETWTTLASNSVDRGYHSTSILLPDGRVLHAGSGQGGGQDGILNAELFSPPYLFLGPRPEISAAPSRVGYGTTFHLRTSDADIARVSLIRLGSTTHAFDMNQRFQWLSFERATGGLQIIAPTSRHVTPPGHYMLFILNEAGVPSVAKIVQIGSSGDPPPPPDAAPTAGFTVTCAGFDCEFTDSSIDDGEVTAWSWDFDDNSGTSVERNPRYAYTAEGSYDVTLTVTDDNGATATITRTITVALPPPNSSPTAGFAASCAGLTCTFTDQSSDSDGRVTAWGWTFGDGAEAATPNPSHTYAAEGSYEVTLVATDDDDATGTATQPVTVTPPPPNSSPTAGFTASCTGLTCTFTDQSSDGDGSVTGWSWVFGDGASATTQNPSHSYATEGPYEVSLVATDDDDASGTATQTVTVTPLPPNAPPTAGFSSSCTGLTCTFTDQSSDGDGSVTAWSWSFGDGVSATTRNPSRTYAANGTYSVTLVASDDDNATGSATQTVTVTAPVTRAINLTVTGRSDATKQYMTLQWSGAIGATLDVFRNGTRITNTANDGHYTNSRTYQGDITYTYRVCEPGTSVCSNYATVVFGSGGTPNQPPVANFSPSCNGTTCSFADLSTDSDGSITAWSWAFGDGITSTVRSPSYTYAAEGSFEVSLLATDDDGATATTTKTLVVAAPEPNSPPTAGFAATCAGRTCTFTDQSSDGDGSVTGWSWTFGDGATATTRNPSRTYAANGSYTVTLVATDNDGATGTEVKAVTVSGPTIVLSVTSRSDATTQYMVLTWSGASGAMVDVYRNGALLKTTENDGKYTNTRTYSGAASYTYKVCQAGTTVCSNEAAVVF